MSPEIQSQILMHIDDLTARFQVVPENPENIKNLHENVIFEEYQQEINFLKK